MQCIIIAIKTDFQTVYLFTYVYTILSVSEIITVFDFYSSLL